MKKLSLFTLLGMLFSLSAQAQQVYTAFIPEDSTLTYYFDSKMDSRDGIKEVYNPNSKTARFKKYHEDVVKVIIDASMKYATLTSMLNFFNGDTINSIGNNAIYPLSEVREIEGLKYIDTEDVTDMAHLFDGMMKLESLDLSGFKTDKVTTMYFMFNNCWALTDLNLSSFNTAKVENMSYMFTGCIGLQSLNIASLNTENVYFMDAMFCACRNLKSLDVSHFKTEKVIDMNTMFSGCEALETLDVTNFNTEKVYDMDYMFDRCRSLTTLDLTHFSTAKLQYCISMFAECENLETILCNNDWSQNSPVLEISGNMFEGCVKLVGGNGTKFDKDKTDITYARPDKQGAPGYFTSTPEGIENIQSTEANNKKVFRNGQLLILRNGESYNANGARVE